MSLGKRAYNILRGYVHREWERIQDLDRESAQRELQEALDNPAALPSAEVPSIRTPGPGASDPKEHARKLLGVGPEANFGEIRKAFERLNRRSDPANFPPESVEAREAADLQKRVHWAYGVLTEGMDDTERRFRSLEI
jgi:hypothetical protein